MRDGAIAARLVVDRWSHGDLASAVNGLEHWADGAKRVARRGAELQLKPEPGSWQAGTQITKGDWRRNGTVVFAGEVPVAFCGGPAEAEANAALIAEAPGMQYSLKEGAAFARQIIECWEADGDIGSVISGLHNWSLELEHPYAAPKPRQESYAAPKPRQELGALGRKWVGP